MKSAALAGGWITASSRSFDRTSVGVTALTAILLLAALAPLFMVEIPAMLDYVNHLARMHLLAGPPNPAYRAHWGLYPNLGMDLLVPLLARWMSVATAAKLFLGAGEILVVSGAVVLEVVVKGRHRLGGLAALLVLFSLPFAWGQANFMFGMGLAAWSLALWVGLRERGLWLRWAVHAAAVALLFVTHFFDLGVYGLLIGLYELSRLGPSPDLRALTRLAGFMASPLVPALAVMWLSGGGLGPAASLDWDFGLKLLWAGIFMNVYDTLLSVLTGAALLVLLLALLRARRLSLTRAGTWIAAALAGLYVVVPRQLFGSQYVDVRLLTAAAVMLPAFTTVSLPSRRWRIASVATVVAIIAANDISTGAAWLDYQRDYREFEASFARLAPGSAVLVGRRDGAGRDDQPIFYAATLAAPAAGAFVSSLYAQPGMQPMEPRTRFRALAVKEERECLPPSLAQLRAAAQPGGGAAQANIVDWPERYQYLYLVGPPGGNPLPAELTPLVAGRRFSLYRTRARPSA